MKQARPRKPGASRKRSIPIRVDVDKIPSPTVTLGDPPPALTTAASTHTPPGPLTTVPPAKEAAVKPDVIAEAVLKEEDDIIAVEFAAGSNGGKRSVVGRSVRRNKVAIVLNVEALLLLVDEKLASLRDERPNAIEAQAALAEAIHRYEGVKKQLESLRDATVGLVHGSTSETGIETIAKSFGDYIRNWWDKDHQKICNKAFDAGLKAFDAALFMSCLGICSLVGCEMTVAAVISGTLVGGNRITNALKAASSLVRTGRTKKGTP